MQVLRTSCLAAVALVVVAAQPARAEVEAEDVRQAISRGINYLQREQAQDGTWDEYGLYNGGITSLCTLALLQAGVEPDDPSIQRALRFLRNPRFRPGKTYVVSLQTMVFAAAEPEKDLARIRRNVQWLENAQIKQGNFAGCWGYPGLEGDNSNTQFAMLALHEAERAGVEVSRRTWQLALDYWDKAQNHDGSWGYKLGSTSGRGSMTCAGISSVVIAQGKLTKGDAYVEGGQVTCCGAQAENRIVQDALDWFNVQGNFSLSTNPRYEQWYLYYLYGLERAARLTSQRFIGGRDWYREGAEQLVRLQDRLSGFWRGKSGLENDNPHVATAFALLFLAKGRRPVMVGKLKHTPEEDWDRHRGDVNNLTRHVEKEWGFDLSWQVVEADDATVDDLIQSPIIFFNGKFAPDFTDEQVQELRKYIEQGGYIVADSCCGGTAFDRGFRELMKRIFPEEEFELSRLEPTHPVWGAYAPVGLEGWERFPLWGVNYACRTCVFYCPKRLSCYWELSGGRREDDLPAEVEKDIELALSVGTNIVQYATNRELKYKYEIPRTVISESKPDAVDRAKLYIGKLRHSGGWNVAPAALLNLMRALNQKAEVRANTDPADRRDLDPGEQRLFNYPIVFMHGRSSFSLSPEAREQLRTFVSRGGLLFSDAICGSRQFSEAFRREMELIFPESKFERIPSGHPLLTDAYGGYDLKTVSRREPGGGGDGPRKTIVREVEPELWGIKVGDRWAVIFSPYDLSCALENQGAQECKGYTPEDAEKIGINIVLYSFHH